MYHRKKKKTYSEEEVSALVKKLSQVNVYPSLQLSRGSPASPNSSGETPPFPSRDQTLLEFLETCQLSLIGSFGVFFMVGAYGGRQERELYFKRLGIEGDAKRQAWCRTVLQKRGPSFLDALLAPR